MKFRLLIESHAYTTIRELHVERVTGPITDLKRDHVDILSLEPVAGRLDDLTDIDKQGTHEPPLVGPKTAGEPDPPRVTRNVRVEVKPKPDALKDGLS